ncbi:LysR substrate-binding domain-containing protein [Aquabacterium commune]|uniref:LysR substrate-binding domain-containing protein n=1 Tax=Aquabacterium commune TaxID=70586 RepID=UPI0010603FC0
MPAASLAAPPAAATLGRVRRVGSFLPCPINACTRSADIRNYPVLPRRLLEGSLTISASRPVVSTVLAPLVEAFSVLHPKLSLRIASLDDDAPMPEVDDEVTFSLGKPANEEIAVTPLMEIVFVHCASPSYLRCPLRFGAGSSRVRSTRDGDRTDEEPIHGGTDHWIPA